jgi:hypothetical protein
MDEARCRRLIDVAVDKFKLDLSGLVVLTEAATGYYILTPLIAALSGAQRVYALTQDSRYGKAVDVCDQTMALACRWGVSDRIEVLFSREDKRVEQADIVTNTGFVRPLDKPFLQRLKSTAVIPLMWETWEYRPEDLDLAECRRIGIPVLGTNEHHPDLQIFKYIGHIALKLLFALEIEGFRSEVVVIGSGEFAEQVITALRSVGANATLVMVSAEGKFDTDLMRQSVRQADALVVVEHHSRRMLIGCYSEISADELYSLNPSLVVAHICGNVDRKSLNEVGLRCYPDQFAPPGYMSVATDYLGPHPLIDLHTAGLKVGERLARARARGLSASQAEFTILKETPLAQEFSGHHS